MQRGSSGVVHLALDIATLNRVAIKLVPREKVDLGTAREVRSHYVKFTVFHLRTSGSRVRTGPSMVKLAIVATTVDSIRWMRTHDGRVIF